MWQGVGGGDKNRCRMDDDYDDINETELASAVPLSESYPEIPFRFWG